MEARDIIVNFERLVNYSKTHTAEETVEEILKDIYYGAAEVIQKEASRWAGVTRND